ncbi:hypothetical protein [Collimonas pratensis]|uniref:Uncharacterized protein n=1 Tax=Collimonas pratensis TaxID=279113 RepID=A0A127Q963_9BURK|nr:hypothetical protein [Collimonas pratensis]AMP06564.1 hypothetical protein CPter91_4249 [Collimonas pratensis]
MLRLFQASDEGRAHGGASDGRTDAGSSDIAGGGAQFVGMLAGAGDLLLLRADRRELLLLCGQFGSSPDFGRRMVTSLMKVSPRLIGSSRMIGLELAVAALEVTEAFFMVWS